MFHVEHSAFSLSYMQHFLDIKDYLVSGETFTLMWDEERQLLKTHPEPKDLSIYYESSDYLSHNDRATGLLANIYRTVKIFNLKNKSRLVEEFAGKDKTLLDYGAGTGDFLVAARKRGFEAEGVETSARARIQAIQKGVPLGESLPDNKTYSAITLWHVLEHLPQPQLALDRLKALLADDGALFIAVPNFKSYDAAYYREFWAAYDVPRHLWHFSKPAIRAMAQDLDLEIIAIRPMRFDAYYISLLSEKHRSGSYNIINAMITGWRSNFAAMRSGEYSSLLYILRKPA